MEYIDFIFYNLQLRRRRKKKYKMFHTSKSPVSSVVNNERFIFFSFSFFPNTRCCRYYLDTIRRVEIAFLTSTPGWFFIYTTVASFGMWKCGIVVVGDILSLSIYEWAATQKARFFHVISTISDPTLSMGRFLQRS